MFRKIFLSSFIIIFLHTCIQPETDTGSNGSEETLVNINSNELASSDLAIPGASTMDIDFASLDSSSYYKLIACTAVGSCSNFNRAAILASTASTVTAATISPYAAILGVLAYKIVYQPATLVSMVGEYEKGKLVKVVISMSDTVSFSTTSVSYNAKFTGEDLDPTSDIANVSWKLEFECISPDSFCENLPEGYFTFFEGETPKTKDANGYVMGEGFWSLKGPWIVNESVTLFSKEIFRIDFNIVTEATKTYLTINNTGALEGEGDILKYCYVSPSMTIDFNDYDDNDNDTLINYDSTTEKGSLTSGTFTDSVQSCWDENHTNATCTDDITSVCQ